MARARGDAGLDGFLNLCKGRGPTSHDTVTRVRRVLGTRRVGHAGTLDPLAEGVLPLALGRATRLIDRLAAADKEYYGEARLGVRTTTDDAEGDTVAERPVPRFDVEALDAALAHFVGEIDQRPPAYSALKVAGRRAYELARAGQEISLPGRRVTIYRIERRRWEWPVVGFRVVCSKGTYVRSLARDLGERLGVGASLCRLVRLRVGPFRLEEAVSVEEVEPEPLRAVLPPDAVLLDEPALVLDRLEHDHLRHGRPWPGAGDAVTARAYAAGELAGLVAAEGGRWQPRLTLVD